MFKRSFQNPFKSGRRKSKWQGSIEAELRQQQQRSELVSALTLQIRQSLQLQEILNLTVTQVQCILKADRVLVYQLLPNGNGKIISEAVSPGYPKLMSLEFSKEIFPEASWQLYAQGQMQAISNLHNPAAELADCFVKFAQQFGIQAKLIVPIVLTLPVYQPIRAPGQNPPQTQLWGLFIAHQCRSPREWIQFERDLMQQLADHMSIALVQAHLFERLEEVVEARTAELRAANHTLQKEINVRIQAEAELRQREELISVVSHELRTPLTSLQSALKVLATGQLGDLSVEGQHLLAIADESTERLIRFANSILELQRIESDQVVIELQACNAADLITQAVEAMQAMAQQYEVTLRTQTKDLFLWVDADYIVQTLINLLSNAIKFSFPGGSVWLTVDWNGSSSSSEVIFRVRDQGQGIPADQLERIFERFQQVGSSDSRKKGTGLGLTICRRIIEQHQGKIWAESVLGCGSTFAFTLPIPIQHQQQGRK